MNGGFRYNVSVETVAEVDGVYVVTGAISIHYRMPSIGRAPTIPDRCT
jgi:hypothetical protein